MVFHKIPLPHTFSHFFKLLFQNNSQAYLYYQFLLTVSLLWFDTTCKRFRRNNLFLACSLYLQIFSNLYLAGRNPNPRKSGLPPKYLGVVASDCPVLPRIAPDCLVLPRIAPFCPGLPRIAPFCLGLPRLAFGLGWILDTTHMDIEGRGYNLTF